MTSAFAIFIEQYNMTGSEKADGYSACAFTGLSEQEKEEVFRILETELPWSAEWLFFLDRDRAIAVAKEMEAALRTQCRDSVHYLQKQLVKFTGDFIYQQHMVDGYATHPASVRAAVISAVDVAPANRAQIDFFKQVLRTERDERAVFRAGWHLLDKVNFPGDRPVNEKKYDDLLDDLRMNRAEVNLRVLETIEAWERMGAAGRIDDAPDGSA